jgi:hypothetical protein
VLLHVARVIEFESPLHLICRRSSIPLCLQCFAVDPRARSQILLGVGEQVVRASSDEVGATDFWVCD